MKRAIRATLAALVVATLLPVNNANAQGVIHFLFSGEMHIPSHKCSTIKKVMGGGTCNNDVDKQVIKEVVFYASSKKPKKSGAATQCFALKVSTTAAKGGGNQVRGPLCDINLVGAKGKALPELGDCEAHTGPFAGTLAFYSDHFGDPLGKKVSNVVGTLEKRGGMGFATGSEKKKTKAQGGDLMIIFRVTSQDLETSDTDSIDDCHEIAGQKDPPTQVGIDGIGMAVQEDQ